MNLFGRPKKGDHTPTSKHYAPLDTLTHLATLTTPRGNTRNAETINPTPPASSTPQTSDTGAAIARLRDTTEVLEKREEHLARKIQNEMKQARELNAANKKREALTCMKRMKMYEKQLEQLSNTKISLETQRLALENLSINRETLEAQRIASSALQRETKRMGGVEAVEETMDGIEDGLADAREIGDAMARTVGDGYAEDEDELLAELEGLAADDDALTQVASDQPKDEMQELEAELNALTAPTAPTNKPLPSAPKEEAMTDEERELLELEKSMAM